MADVLNLALPYFSLIFVGFACARLRPLPEQGLAWMNFFLLYVSLPALLFGITSRTPFEELNNPPFLIATTCGTALAFFLAMAAGRLVGRLSFRDATLAGLSGGYGNIGYMGPGLALAVLGAKASAPTALIFCCDSIFLFSVVPFLIALTDHSDHHWLHALGLLIKQIALNPLIMSACAGALAAAFCRNNSVLSIATGGWMCSAAASAPAQADMISGLRTICRTKTPSVCNQCRSAPSVSAINSGTIENRKMLSQQKIRAVGAEALAPSTASASPGPI